MRETDSKVKISAIEAPESEFGSLLDVFEKTLVHEQKITALINKLVDAALAEKDFSTFNFLQWYVNEQHEEEALFRGIVDKIKLLGEGGRSVFMADAYIKTLAK